ncbi:hypothetical protein [Yoonia sp. SS1-5]|uniref:Uncharacterized protein n=1 Tax=Yoonia rhodophyticola TaxID=3137370 RepID=A0AAN0M750_9RHOB
MNTNRLIKMAIRMLMRRGVNKGIDLASRRGKHADDMTPQARETAQNTRKNTQQARRGLNMLRRFMR